MRSETRAGRDRGSVVVLATLAMGALLTMAAIAVDLSYAYLMGQRIQRAADAAALAAAQEWQIVTGTPQEREDAAEDEVERMLRHSDMGDTTRFAVAVSATATGRVEVTLTDTRPPRFFAGVVGRQPTVTRSSAADMGCAECPTRTLVLSTMTAGINASGEGDGMAPVVIDGDRLYALNHHHAPGQPSLSCVSRVRNDRCLGYEPNGGPGNRVVSSGTNHWSPLLFDEQRSRLWFAHHSTAGWGLECWQVHETDSRLDAPCAMSGDVDAAGRVLLRPGHPMAPGSQWFGRGVSMTASPVRSAYPQRFTSDDESVDRLHVLADDGRVYCFDLRTNLSCGSPVSRLSAAGLMPADMLAAQGGNGNGYTSEVVDDLMFSAAVWRQQPSGRAVVGIDCFDMDAGGGRSCTGFGTAGGLTWTSPEQYYAGGDAPVLFPYLDQQGEPTGICTAPRAGGTACFDLDDGSSVELPSALRTAMTAQHTGSTRSCVFYQEAVVGTRMFMPRWFCGGNGGHQDFRGRTICFDWATQATCGVRVWSLPVSQGGIGVETTDYGYVVVGRPEVGHCLIGLGDAAYWWSFDAEDMGPCRSAVDGEWVSPCACSDGTDRQRWGVLRIEPEDLQLFSRLRLLVYDDDRPGAQLLAEIDVLEDHPTGIVDLDRALPGDVRSRSRLYVVLAGQFPDDGTPPVTSITATIDFRSSAVLRDDTA